MLQLTDISIQFDQHIVLNQLSCTVNKGDFIVIVGANGSGKTTLFDLIAGKLRPTHGTITLHGNDITKRGELERAAFISRLFQNTQLNTVAPMTVAQNLAMANYKGRAANFNSGMKALSRADAQKLLASINLEHVIDKPMWSLSGGQRQLIAFSMATLVQPTILMLDEPTAALDPAAATTLLKTAAQYVKDHKITTLLITHDPHIALSLGNKLWVLENGKITKQFEGAQKNGLSPEHLIGHIDYAALG